MSGGIYVSSIQRTSYHDGPGIRTTVFLKGCPLHCPWCANPENICEWNQFWFDEDQCVGNSEGCALSLTCSRIEALARRGEICTEADIANCPMSALKKIASKYCIEGLENEVMKDRVFWGDRGGVTFSGGEPLLQARQLEPLLERMHELGIDICFETALFVAEDAVRTVMRYISRLYIDMKIMDSEDCAHYLGGDIRMYCRNLKLVASSGIPYTIRIPLIRPYTYNEKNLNRIKDILEEFDVADVEIFACHNLGDKKYIMLGKTPMACENVSEEEVDATAKMLGAEGRTVTSLQLG